MSFLQSTIGNLNAGVYQSWPQYQGVTQYYGGGTIRERLVNKQATIQQTIRAQEAELAKVNDALQALDENPTIAKVLELIGKAGLL